MRIFLMTDMEGTAGVMNFADWCSPGDRYYELGREFVTREANAAIDGFFAAGATAVTVADGHGAGAIAPQWLDARAELMRGWPEGFPFGLEPDYDGIAWVGQHAKAGTPLAHLAHTQSCRYIDLAVNGISIGEFGQMALCAAELGVPVFFGAGDLAFTLEAAALVPGIETAWVKRGRAPGNGDDLDLEGYTRRNISAVHLAPAAACARIRTAAYRAARRLAQGHRPRPTPIAAPYVRVGQFRAAGDLPRQQSRETHDTSVIALMNLPFSMQPAS